MIHNIQKMRTFINFIQNTINWGLVVGNLEKNTHKMVNLKVTFIRY